jgi:hypothetical protein
LERKERTLRHTHQYETIRQCKCGKEITPKQEYRIMVNRLTRDENFNNTQKQNVGKLEEH